MKVLIVEDESLAAERLSKMLYEVKPDIKILSIIDSVENAVKWFEINQEPDLLFLDIQLADGLSFEIYDQIKFSCPVVFTTAFDEYAIKAFDLNSIDYLLKPIKKEKLESSINKYLNLQNLYGKGELNQKLENLIRNYQLKPKSFKSRFLVNKGSSLIPISTSEIAYFFAEDKVVLFKTFENQQFVVNYSLDNLEKELDPKVFFRINRQFIISINSVEKVNTYFNYKLKLDLIPPCEKDIIIARQRVSDFKDWMDL